MIIKSSPSEPSVAKYGQQLNKGTRCIAVGVYLQNVKVRIRPSGQDLRLAAASTHGVPLPVASVVHEEVDANNVLVHHNGKLRRFPERYESKLTRAYGATAPSQTVSLFCCWTYGVSGCSCHVDAADVMISPRGTEFLL